MNKTKILVLCGIIFCMCVVAAFAWGEKPYVNPLEYTDSMSGGWDTYTVYKMVDHSNNAVCYITGNGGISCVK